MYESFVFSDNQTFTNLSSTGEVSDNVWDFESSSSGVAIGQTRFNIRGFLNIVITSVAYTSGGTEGITFRLLHDSAAAALTTSRATSGAGFYVLCSLGIAYDEIVAGRTFSIPFQKDRCLKWIGFWPVATSTTYTGALKFDAHFSSEPESSVILNTQKRPNTSFG